MPSDHQSHQPNTLNGELDDLDSDLDLEIDELGPSRDSRLDRNAKGARIHETGQSDHTGIPLKSLRNGSTRLSGRRAKRFESNSLEDAPGDGTHTREGSLSQNIGDATPLLAEDNTKQKEEKASNGSILAWIGIRSRRAEYQNITDAGEEDNDTTAPRTIDLGQWPPPKFPANAISNAKYTPWSFLPRTLYNEFSFFINLYFLTVALSQLIPPLRIGVLWTYMAPLAFVLTITLGKEAYDDVIRRKRDGEANRELYTKLRLRGPMIIDRNKASRRKNLDSTRRRRTSPSRLDAISEEEEETGTDLIQMDEVLVKSKDIKVGDVLKLSKNDRVPADVVLLKSFAADTSFIPVSSKSAEQDELLLEETVPMKDLSTKAPVADPEPIGPDGSGSGETFIRTDQLDGETDWKLRVASQLTQSLHPSQYSRLSITAGKPSKKVNEFLGKIELSAVPSGDVKIRATSEKLSAPLSLENTAWANTVLSSNVTVLAAVVYTGSQTRQALSTAPSRSKVGLLELEINNLTKILCLLTLTLSAVLVILQVHFKKLQMPWYVSLCRFLILFSSIIPISLRVNLDIGKTVYAYNIHHDKDMPGAVVRTSTIPEDLGRIEYLLSDKTGTLTQNEMDLRKIHIGTVSYANEAMEEVSSYIKQGFSTGSTDVAQSISLVTPSSLVNHSSTSGQGTRTRREIGSRVRDVVLALALCHNVTPTTEEEDGFTITAYQASSPDEIAIVKWTESVGLRVVHRDRHNIALQSVDTSRIIVRVRILEVFPFTSDSKRMGIILQYLEGTESTTTSDTTPSEIWFYQKGADTVMALIVAANDWLEEETANMAREGLRTLVVGRRKLSSQQYSDFTLAYKEASMSLRDRDAGMARVIKYHLEHNLELLGVTGVEDRLQEAVKPSLELLRNAGVKIWMLTGDKVETARCVAISSKLVSRHQHIHTITSLAKMVASNPTAVSDTISLLAANPDSTALLIDGDSLSYLLNHHQNSFISLAVLLPAVIACRCSPTQKMDVALLIRRHTRKRIACIGDGGNDVSMIQAADIGVGIVGKEGHQASLAADFSITQFHHLTKLLVWHGRNSYKRSAKLSLFIIHRGLVVSIAQTIFSISASYQPDALFRDWLIVGYATLYTQLPIFALVLDRDVDETLTNLYPELYKDLKSGRTLNYKSFLTWVFISTYQGITIQLLSQFLTHRIVEPSSTSLADPRMALVSFTALVINESLMAGIGISTWHWAMGVAIGATLAVYGGTLPGLGAYFDLQYVLSWWFLGWVSLIVVVAVVPVWAGRALGRMVWMPSYRKVRGV